VLVLQMVRIYAVRRLDGLRWHGIHTKFHDDQFRYSSNIKVNTPTIGQAAIFVLLTGMIYEVRRCDFPRWHNIHTKFNKNRL
jgi:hypothetical protein